MTEPTAPPSPRQDLMEAYRAYDRARTTMKKRRAELHAAVVSAVESGMSKSEAGRLSGYTREYVAKIVDPDGPAAP